jgi:hypothetical protein
MKKLFLAAVLFTAIFTSCKKDDSTVASPVIIPKALETSVIANTFFINQATTITASGAGSYEYGFKFAVTQNGKITKLGSKMPQAGNYRVTLWDASVTPKVILGSATITQAAGVSTLLAITPLSLTTGKDYFVSIWSNSQWYNLVPTAGGNFPYPITTGSIIIKGYQWIGSPSTPQTFPTTVDNSYVAGLADFEFQAD